MHPGRNLPYNSKLVSLAKELRANPTDAERKLWDDFLRTFKPRMRRQKPIDNYIADFYCASARLVIEVDGAGHQDFHQKEYDLWRSKVLQSYGIEVIRFRNTRFWTSFLQYANKLRKKLFHVLTSPYKGGLRGVRKTPS